jgi:phage gpG-like protein
MSDGLIVGQIVGSERVQSRLMQTSLQQQKRVRMTVNALGVTLQGKVKNNYLSGQSLNVRSGRGRRSINVSNTEDGTSYSSSVGTNVPYMAFWEKGFDRKIGAGARGGPRRNLTELAAVKYWAKHPPGTKHEDARPFLQPALADMKDDIRARLASAIDGTAA